MFDGYCAVCHQIFMPSPEQQNIGLRNLFYTLIGISTKMSSRHTTLFSATLVNQSTGSQNWGCRILQIGHAHVEWVYSGYDFWPEIEATKGRSKYQHRHQIHRLHQVSNTNFILVGGRQIYNKDIREQLLKHYQCISNSGGNTQNLYILHCFQQAFNADIGSLSTINTLIIVIYSIWSYFFLSAYVWSLKAVTSTHQPPVLAIIAPAITNWANLDEQFQ